MTKLIQIVSELVCQLVIIIFLATFLELLLPKGDFRRYIRMIVGIMVILIIISPLYRVFGILPNLEPVFSSMESEVNSEDLLRRSTELQRHNEELILKEYRQNIYDRVAWEITEEGQWEVVSVNAEIEENFDAPDFGEIRTLSVVIKPDRKSDMQRSGSVVIEQIDISINGDSQVVPLFRCQPPVEDEIKDKLVHKLSAVFQLPAEDISVSLTSNN